VTAILLDFIIENFLRSALAEQFNGISAFALEELTGSADIRNEISELIKAESCSACFESTHINPNIKRLPDIEISQQLELMKTERLASTCTYPSRKFMEARLEPTIFSNKPFTRKLALAAAQFEFVGFELAVMDRYVQDLNYSVDFHDYMGTMSILDHAYLNVDFVDRDKVSHQTFGLGFDAKRSPCIVVFYRYLADLSSEHQQYWNSFMISGDVKMTSQYFQSRINGQFWENRSARYALVEEMKLINSMTNIIWRKQLFRTTEFPLGIACISVFSRPTLANYNAFIHELDKMLSENIRKDFFDDFPHVQRTSTSGNGKVEQKGTIQLLKD
jgi:hypothetical protein